jgi:hypothetical protein
MAQSHVFGVSHDWNWLVCPISDSARPLSDTSDANSSRQAVRCGWRSMGSLNSARQPGPSRRLTSVREPP